MIHVVLMDVEMPILNVLPFYNDLLILGTSSYESSSGSRGEGRSPYAYSRYCGILYVCCSLHLGVGKRTGRAEEKDV